ncbi:hypothetical protein CK203_026361 [Vitis vinifera]|uniref:Integrase zinc-binding domain-containing protein n=1 Tax=Vitis vinifera TaxID=29760 RepID=A0A438IW05_VITVI|nr:hypothetical protein CK203_026361 [Vitis vinifera]
MLIYYVSKAMVDAETQYSKMEQTTLALKSITQKLRPYFQAHQVIVLMNQPLISIFHKLNMSKRMLKWAIELSEYKIKYQPRLALKGQAMANFIAKLPLKPSHLTNSPKEGWWVLYVDEAYKASGSGKEYEAKDEHMARYLALVQDSLAKLGKWVIERATSSITLASICSVIESDIDWMHEIVKYLQTRELPGYEKHARKIQVNHASGRTLAHRTHTQGYYWPIIRQDTKNYVKRCDRCQKYTPISNGQIEATNKTLLTTLKKMLEKAKGKWVDKLPRVLWVYRITPRRSTRTTPFALAYGMETVIPIEIGMPTTKTTM